MPNNYKTYLFVFLLIFSMTAYAQSVVQLQPYNGTPETELITQIIADTVANNGIPADRVYELTAGSAYIVQQIFYIPADASLRLRSSGDVKPLVYLYPSGSGDNPQNPPGYLFRSRGGDLEMTGLAVSGIFEPVDSNFWNMQGGFLRNDGEGASFRLIDCIFSNISGQIMRMEAATKTIEIRDCIFTNMGNLGTSNLGAGKGVDLRSSSCDSLIFVNNTFTNYTDRVIRHYNFGNPLEGTGNLNYAIIDHNTFYGGMGFHGLLSMGNLGYEVVITNNLFVDAFAAGEDSTDGTRAQEFANNLEFYPNGNNRITWIFSAPNDSTDWYVHHNYYAVSAAGQAFFDANTAEPIVVGNPLTWHINGKLGADSASAFTMIDYPDFANVQDLMTGTMEYYVDPALGNKTKNTPSELWVREEHDMDRRPLSYWRDDFDVSYSTSSPAYTGAVGSFPAGNLNAYPSMKADWESFILDVENPSEVLPGEYKLSQNYPNPFNPATVINYTVPEQANVTIKIYDVLGSEVATLLNNVEVAAGSYDVTFDASRLSSGIYFYTLNAGNFIQTKKMTLIK